MFWWKFTFVMGVLGIISTVAVHIWHWLTYMSGEPFSLGQMVNMSVMFVLGIIVMLSIIVNALVEIEKAEAEITKRKIEQIIESLKGGGE
ncbi:MAG: hypothetical protein FWH12_02255 [Treponema sp.]|nr:hypothetical protein [Treponema sp.]